MLKPFQWIDYVVDIVEFLIILQYIKSQLIVWSFCEEDYPLSLPAVE